MAFLSAVLLAGGRLASDLEIVAFGRRGERGAALPPVLLDLAVIMAATAWFTLVLNPLANREFQRQLFRFSRRRRRAGSRSASSWAPSGT
jgi:lipopolysaccharide export LptBFGC system permease protein LptF